MSSGRHIGWLGPIWDGFVVASLLDSSAISRMTVALSSCGITPCEHVFFFLLFLKKKKKKALCLFSTKWGLGCTDAAVWSCGPGSGASNLQGSSPGLCGGAPWAGLGGG